MPDNKKIQEYKIVKRTSSSLSGLDLIGVLEARVNELIKEGWQPIGGIGTIYIDTDYGYWGYYQAMVR